MYSDIKFFLYKPIVPLTISFLFLLLAGLQIVTTVKNSTALKNANSNAPVLRVKPKGKKTATEIKIPLFGEYVPANLNETTVKQSMINLHVVGVLFSKNENNSQVIIRMANGEEHTYKVGDVLPGGVVLKRITPEGILISREGAIESLNLPKNELLFQPKAKALQGDKP